MNLAQRAPVPRPNGGQPIEHLREVVIDLISSDSDSHDYDSPGPSDSDLDLDDDDDDDNFFLPEVYAPPAPPRLPPQAQARRRPSPHQQVVVIDSPSPSPEPFIPQPALPAIRRPVQQPQRDISSSPEFQPARVARAPRDSPSPPFRYEEQLAMAAPQARHQNLYDSDDDSESPIPVGRPAPDARPALNARQGIMGDYVQDEEFDEAMMAQIMGQFGEVEQNANAAALQEGFQPPANAPPAARPVEAIAVESKEECIENVITLFPGICEDFVGEIYKTVSSSSGRLIAYILDRIEKGTPYPSARDKQKVLKRKRDLDEDEEAVRKYGALDRVIPAVGAGQGVRALINTILTQEFKDIPAAFVNAALGQSGYRLFSTYRVLEEAQRTWDPAAPTYQKLKKNRAANEYRDENLPQKLVEFINDQPKQEIIEELIAARRLRRKADQKRQELRQAELAEEENTRTAEAEGTMSECGCCMGDYPMNRMVHCDNDEMHWFCRGCALKTAETAIENARYEITCMSMDGCDGGFSLEQRTQFLDANTVIALERNEQESNLRLAGIENLASCPFCPYAAEYPPIEVNRLFECQRPDCEKISCRLCKLESHIPKSCEENAKENGLSVRRLIEEAMSAALIRTCNKCQTPFIKEEGCNKMTCTRPGCHNIQCYVCSKSCGYEHFNDPSRGGKPENCPLFEKTDERHEKEVKDAEKAAMDKVLADHPEYTEEDLRVKVSDEVQADEARRKANDPQARMQARMAALNAAQGPHGVRFGDVRILAQPQFGRRIARRAPNMAAAPAMPDQNGVGAQNNPGDPDRMMFDNWDDHLDQVYDFHDDGDDVMALFNGPGRFVLNNAPAQQLRALPRVEAGAPNNQVNIAQEGRQQQDLGPGGPRLARDYMAAMNRAHALRVHNPVPAMNAPGRMPLANIPAAPVLAAEQYPAQNLLQQAERRGDPRYQYANAIHAGNVALAQDIIDRRARLEGGNAAFHNIPPANRQIGDVAALQARANELRVRLQARNAALHDNPPANVRNAVAVALQDRVAELRLRQQAEHAAFHNDLQFDGQDAAAAAVLVRAEGLQEQPQAELPALRGRQVQDPAERQVQQRRAARRPHREGALDDAMPAYNPPVVRRNALVLPQHIRNEPVRQPRVKQEAGQQRVKQEEEEEDVDFMD